MLYRRSSIAIAIVGMALIGTGGWYWWRPSKIKLMDAANADFEKGKAAGAHVEAMYEKAKYVSTQLQSFDVQSPTKPSVQRYVLASRKREIDSSRAGLR